MSTEAHTVLPAQRLAAGNCNIHGKETCPSTLRQTQGRQAQGGVIASFTENREGALLRILQCAP